MSDARTKAAGLSIWSGPVAPQLLSGGITNLKYVVEDAGRKYVVRIGDDMPEHQIMRFNEAAASRAAELIGISPAVHHHEPGVLVIDFVEGHTLTEEDVRTPGVVERILPIVKRCHRDIPSKLRGPALMFWVFHVIRDYAATLEEGESNYRDRLPELLAAAEAFERAVGPVDIVFGHNDLLPSNFIDDGKRIWLVDWDYAGFNSPLFDLGGLASNNGLTPDQEEWLLEDYFETPLTDELRFRYLAMKCASLLRETTWSMVSEIHSLLDFDYATYTAENLARFEQAYDEFKRH